MAALASKVRLTMMDYYITNMLNELPSNTGDESRTQTTSA